MSWQDKTREQLIQEMETLRRRVAELETEADSQESGGEVSQIRRDQALLSETAINLMSFPLDGDIYQFIGEQLKEWSGGRFVIVNTFDAEIEQVRVRAVVGWNRYRKTILDILGTHPIGMKLSLSEEAKVGLFTRELERVPSGLYGVAFRQIPQSVCHALEKMFNLGDFYGMGFVREGHLFGSIVLVLDRDAELKNPQAVKAFMGLAAVALQRRQAEAALFGSERRLRAAERLARLGHFEVDVSRGEVVWSDETFRIFGMRPDQAAPTVEAYRELVYEEDRARVGEHLDRLLERTAPFDLVYRIVTVDGDVRYVHSLGKAEEDPETGEVRVFGTLQDITARRRAEEELEHQRQLWDALMDNTPDLVYFKDNEHRMIRASRAYADVLGMDTQDLVGKTAVELWPEEGEEILADERSVLAGKPLIRKERKVTTPAGESLWYLLTKIPIYADDDVIGFFAIDKDITKRKKAEEALREYQERLLKILDGIDADIYVADMETYEVLFLNRHMRASFGEDLVGKICWEVFRGGAGPCAHCTNDRLLDAEGDPSGVITWEGQNPITGNWYINCDRAIKWVDGRLVRLQIATDITERKQAEEALRESNLRLEEALTDLKAAQETMLQQARLAAVGQLSAGIAHDFRNLLSTIILYAQLCQHEIDIPSRMGRYIEIIIGESKKAADLVQQILDFSGRSMLRTQVVDLRTLVHNVIDILRRTIPETIQLSLETKADEVGEERHPYRVRVDPGRIQQALTNLALNARDAMPGGGELRFELSHIEIVGDETLPLARMSLLKTSAGALEEGRWICLAISDTGIGMTDEVRDHLFEPFFTTKEVDEGTGLGLAQVYGIVRQHDGYITVETEPGGGTTFRIYLPAYQEEITPVDADTASEPESEGEASLLPPEGQGETILLVEDEEMLREAEREMLESLGYRVLTAANGREALALCQSSRWSGESPCRQVDLIITDMVMPEMGGEELVRELRKRDPNLRALGITGYSGKTVTEALREVGFLDVIRKPFEVEALARVIRRALRTNID